LPRTAKFDASHAISEFGNVKRFPGSPPRFIDHFSICLFKTEHLYMGIGGVVLINPPKDQLEASEDGYIER
jgi:hypothetical protein